MIINPVIPIRLQKISGVFSRIARILRQRNFPKMPLSPRWKVAEMYESTLEAKFGEVRAKQARGWWFFLSFLPSERRNDFSFRFLRQNGEIVTKTNEPSRGPCERTFDMHLRRRPPTSTGRRKKYFCFPPYRRGKWGKFTPKIMASGLWENHLYIPPGENFSPPKVASGKICPQRKTNTGRKVCYRCHGEFKHAFYGVSTNGQSWSVGRAPVKTIHHWSGWKWGAWWSVLIVVKNPPHGILTIICDWRVRCIAACTLT